MAIVDAQHLSVISIIEKLGGSATCKTVFEYASQKSGYDLPNDIKSLQNTMVRMRTHHSLLKHPADNDKLFALTEKAKRTLAEADKEPPPMVVDVVPSEDEDIEVYPDVDLSMSVIGLSKNLPINSKEAAKQLAREYLSVVDAYKGDGGATAEDVLEYVTSHDGFSIPHDRDKICKSLSGLKQKRGFFLDAPEKKNNRIAVVLSQAGQDLLNGIDPPKTNKPEDVDMNKQKEAMPTTQTVDELFDGLRNAIMNNVTKLPADEKAKFLKALDKMIASNVICSELREDLTLVRSFINSIQEA